MKLLTIAALTALCSPVAALAESSDLQIADAYARSSNPKSGAAFMTIRNTGDQDCTLGLVSTERADKAELHTSKEDDQGMMRMLPIEGGIEIAAGGEHALARGGDHVMLMGLTEPLEEGDELALTLDFGDCGMVDLTVPVDNKRSGTEDSTMEGGHQPGHSG
ncbi:copper chaperone PCu(A)C [Paracoccus sediminicola]|uniref:copper chaperone PCu(A)C n=1 Tax=Paracoccus sediminicola TaxID=3017783 RepID=UPI0022F06AAD|nr:copper chaperone PCu(A)C [Paracoccus sediminicola]WBU56966.1 copper chaperone PCu(A)C [Paracoccus sediminicola]